MQLDQQNIINAWNIISSEDHQKVFTWDALEKITTLRYVLHILWFVENETKHSKNVLCIAFSYVIFRT